MAVSVSTFPFKVTNDPTIQYYYIKSKVHGFVLELKDKSQKECTYAVVSRLSVGADHQLWYFKKADDGYLYIVAKLNDLVLDIKGGWRWSGGYLITYPKKALPKIVANQRWLLKGGNIVSQFTSMVAEVKNGSERPGSLVWACPKKTSSNSPRAITSQQWEFIPYIPENPHANLLSFSTEEAGNKAPQVVNDSNTSYYFIKSRLNGLVMEIKKGNEHTGVGVVMASKEEGLCHQLWYFKAAPNDHVYIISKMNDLVLEIKDMGKLKGAKVTLFTRNKPPNPVANQWWKVDMDGYISSQLNYQVMTINEKSSKTKPSVIMWEKIGANADHQRWTFEPFDLDSSKEKYESIDVNTVRSLAGLDGCKLQHTVINESEINSDTVVSCTLPDTYGGEHHQQQQTYTAGTGPTLAAGKPLPNNSNDQPPISHTHNQHSEPDLEQGPSTETSPLLPSSDRHNTSQPLNTALKCSNSTVQHSEHSSEDAPMGEDQGGLSKPSQ